MLTGRVTLPLSTLPPLGVPHEERRPEAEPARAVRAGAPREAESVEAA